MWQAYVKPDVAIVSDRYQHFEHFTHLYAHTC